jgi:hypothetical protein
VSADGNTIIFGLSGCPACKLHSPYLLHKSTFPIFTAKALTVENFAAQTRRTGVDPTTFEFTARAFFKVE